MTGRPALTFERSYEARVEDLWELWTTPEGFESWWGPEGFRVEVRALDLRVGGELVYDMIASDPEQVAALERQGMAASHATRGVFVEVAPPTRLRIRHRIDFLPEGEPYDHDMLLELFAEGARVRMVVTVDPHRDEVWTRAASEGFLSQLQRLPAALAARTAR